MAFLLAISVFLLSNCVLAEENVRSKKDAFDSLKEFGPSLGYRPPPPLVRRDAIMRVKYDPEKWIGESHMTISGAVMFDRTTGLTVNQCLNKCSKPEFQNPETRWICRSLTYDHKWKICDLYAIDGSTSPYFLSEYRHRDYFKYLAALPPTDKEYRTTVLSKEMSAEIQSEEKKFESTTPITTTTASYSSKDFSMTTGSPSELIEPFRVQASKQKFEGDSAFNPFLHLDKFDSSKSESKEEGVNKALASKQTGDSKPVGQQIPQLGEEKKSNTVEYYRKPTLKFAITPISSKKIEEEETKGPKIVKEEEVKVSKTEEVKVPKIVKEEEVKVPKTEEVKEEEVKVPKIGMNKEKFIEPKVIGLKVTEPIEVKITESKVSESNNIKTFVTETVQEEETTKKPKMKSVEVRPKAKVFEKVEEKVVEVTADIGPIETAPSISSHIVKNPKKKIQGITTYKVNDNKPNSQKSNGCKIGEVVQYIQIQEHQRIGNGAVAVKKIDALRVRDCAEACTVETAFQCESAVFSAGKCSLYADSADHASTFSLNKNIKATYLERVCLPARLITNDAVNVYEAIRNYILVGQVQEVTDASTLAKCQIDCLTASENLGFQCKSAMFYPTDIESGQNCLLNSEDHQSKSDAFVSEDAGVNMIYFSMSTGEESNKKSKLGANFQSLDNPIKKDDSEWTKWSKCRRESDDAIRHRYLKCSHQKDIRKCPKQSAMCKPPSLQIRKLARQENECRAVRDSTGTKRCPHGIRYDSRGIRHYCIHPIDC